MGDFQDFADGNHFALREEKLIVELSGQSTFVNTYGISESCLSKPTLSYPSQEFSVVEFHFSTSFLFIFSELLGQKNLPAYCCIFCL